MTATSGARRCSGSCGHELGPCRSCPLLPTEFRTGARAAGTLIRLGNALDDGADSADLIILRVPPSRVPAPSDEGTGGIYRVSRQVLAQLVQRGLVRRTAFGRTSIRHGLTEKGAETARIAAGIWRRRHDIVV